MASARAAAAAVAPMPRRRGRPLRCGGRRAFLRCGGRRLLLASSSLALGANRRFGAMAAVALGEWTVERGVDWRDRSLQSTFNKPPRSPTGGPKGDEQPSGRMRPDAACHPRPRKPSPDLGRVSVIPDAATIRIFGASPYWAVFLSGWIHPNARTRDGSPR
jgi:hypothetical protein